MAILQDKDKLISQPKGQEPTAQVSEYHAQILSLVLQMSQMLGAMQFIAGNREAMGILHNKGIGPEDIRFLRKALSVFVVQFNAHMHPEGML